MLERDYQAMLIRKLKTLFPNAIILKNDAQYLQGIPDILILENDMWAMLEVKASSSASVRPNQRYYVDKLATMSYAAFISPDNEEEILRDLQHAFSFGRPARISEC